MTTPELKDSMQLLARQMILQKIDQTKALLESPWYKAYIERSRAEWAAKTWYEKVRIGASVKLRAARIWLGEKIAGQSFDEWR